MNVAREQLGIIKRVGYGLRDVGYPVLWFTIYTSEHCASLQVFRGEESDRVITEADVYDVKLLEGKPCWVIVDGGLMTFKRMFGATETA